jgi:hypothetical protein
MANFIFFNHFHRGDLFTSKEFVRQIMTELKGHDFSYQHYNPWKILYDLNFSSQERGIHPSLLPQQKFLMGYQKSLMAINTWIGVWGDIFTKHGGVNLLTLTESWAEIFKEINQEYGTDLKIKNDPSLYLPWIDYKRFEIHSIDSWLSEYKDRKKILICNGKPMSNQSFDSNLQIEITLLALKHPDVVFICTEPIELSEHCKNVFFTDKIINDELVFSKLTFWENNRDNNTCDLNEISYLSTHCDVIIGKNSGPFVFCETRDNLMDGRKKIVSFSKGPKESMSYGIEKKCEYHLVTDHSADNILKTMHKVIAE